MLSDWTVNCRAGRSGMRGSVYPYTTKRGERRWRVVFDE
jgi:hypothetical protein